MLDPPAPTLPSFATMLDPPAPTFWPPLLPDAGGGALGVRGAPLAGFCSLPPAFATGVGAGDTGVPTPGALPGRVLEGEDAGTVPPNSAGPSSSSPGGALHAAARRPVLASTAQDQAAKRRTGATAVVWSIIFPIQHGSGAFAQRASRLRCALSE